MIVNNLQRLASLSDLASYIPILHISNQKQLITKCVYVFSFYNKLPYSMSYGFTLICDYEQEPLN